MNFDNKKIIILGAGREGQATARYLQQHHPKAVLTIADQQPIHLNIEHVEQRIGTEYPQSLAEWDLVIVSPGIPPHTPLLKTAQQITTATNIFFDECDGRIIGVTGSKGKSTTASLIFQMLREGGLPVSLMGNIGQPALDALREHNTAEELWVMELSSYQLSRLERGPDIALITSLFPEHIDYHGTEEQYYADKLRIATMQTANQLVIYNQHHQRLVTALSSLPQKHLPYPSTDGAHIINEEVYYGTEQLFAVTNIPLLGEHNQENILGAVTVAKQFEVPNEAIQRAVMQFTSLPHRLQYVGRFHDIDFYDDAISTTPESTIAALRSIPRVDTLIVGGQDRGYRFDELARVFAGYQIRHIVFFPDSGKRIVEALKQMNYTPAQTLHTTSMHDAVAFAYQYTEPGTVCLLSSASPSYNNFKNFEDRGNQFQQAIHELAR